MASKWSGPHKGLSEFRNCFEAGMDFETALGCAGLADASDAVIRDMRVIWDRLQAKSEAA